jgi:hypothetical protein
MPLSTDTYYGAIVSVMEDTSSAWESWLRSWQRSLRGAQPQPEDGVAVPVRRPRARRHLERTGGPGRAQRDCARARRGLILELQERGRTPSGVSLVYRSLQQLMKYLGQEGELDRSPDGAHDAPAHPRS